MSVFYLPRANAIDAGVAVPGAKLNFYTAGTSTRKDTYSDSALTTANSNPVVADANGLFGSVYLASGSYKVVLTDSSDVTLWTQDNVGAGAASLTYNQSDTDATDRTVKARLQDVISVKDFGAVGDGDGAGNGTDDTTAIQAALTAAGGNTLLFPEGIYRCDDSVNMVGNTTIMAYGATLDCSASSHRPRLRAHGSVGSALTLASNATRGDTTLTLSDASSITTEDVLILSSDGVYPEATTIFETLGEFVTVKSKSGNTLTLYSAIDDSYTTADIAQVQKVTFLNNIRILGLKIIGFGASASDTAGSEIGISSLYARNLTIRDCELFHCDYQAISINQTLNANIDGNYIFHERRGNDAWTAVIQYGVTIKDGSSSIAVRNNHVYGGKHGIVWTETVLPGVSRDNVIDGNFVSGTWAAAISTHESNENFTIVNNHIHGCARGMDIRVRKGKICNNEIRNLGDGNVSDGIYLNHACSDLLISGNTIDTARYGIRMYDVGLPATAEPFNIRVQDNVISNITQIGAYFQQSQNTGPFVNFVVQGNSFLEVTGDAIRFDGAFSGPLVSGNSIQTTGGSTGYGVRLMGTTKARIMGNSFDGLTPVRLENDTESSPVAPSNPVIVNNVWDHSTGFFSQTSGSNVILKNNVKTGPSNVTIASGVISVPSGVEDVIVDTESAASTDNLDTINGGTNGDRVTFRAASASRTVSVTESGNIKLSSTPFALDNSEDTITLIYTGTNWLQVSRSDNGA